MKFAAALLSFAATAGASPLPIFGTPSVPKKVTSVTADSTMGQHILSNARRLEQQDEEIDFTWVSGYSLKFQGCHHISQWNEEADGEEDVRIQTKRLVRFRLCPTDYCTEEDAGGCDDGYGDYIIDMNMFLEAYIQNKMQVQEWMCEYTAENVCDCEDDDGKDDGFDRDFCEYDCFMEQDMEYCVENNPYADDEAEQEEEFQLEEYMECAKFEAPNDERRRKLEEEEIEYFLGPYCAEQGGSIYLGLFTDETCTTFADDEAGTETYYDFVGETLPYSAESIVGMECVTCMEPGDADQQNQNDAQDEDEVTEMCEQIYEISGKCESDLADAQYPNENACNYIEGIKIIRRDGVVVTTDAAKNRTVSVAIGIFAVSFILLGAYVFYLRSKLDRSKINLSE